MRYAFRERGAVGIMVVSQGGGWGVGPFSLYRFRGFWRLTDANVYVTCSLAWNCSIDLVNATKAWVIRTFGSDEEEVANLTRLLLLSDGAIEKGLYIRDYARHTFQVFGKWVPPMLWIWWWDVAGSPGIFSLIYRSCAQNLNQNVEEGFEAVAIVEDMIQLANGLNVSTNLHDFEVLQESLLYEKMLLETLAWYRATFLYHLRWAETLDPTYERLFKEALAAFEEKHQSYLSRYDGSSDIFVPYNMDEALTYIQRLKNSPVSTHLSRVGLIVVLGLLAMAAPFIQSRVPKILRKRPIQRAYATLFHAFRLGRDLKRGPATATDGLFILLLFIIVNFISILVLDGFIHTTQILLLTFALGLGVWMLLTGVIFFAGRRQGASAAFSDLMGMTCYPFVPLLVPSLIVLATSSISTPHLFWHGFWIELWFRYGVFLSTFISLLWASMILFLITRRALELTVRASLGVLLTIFGFLMFSTVAAVFFIGADNLLFVLIQALSLFPTAAFYSGAGAPTILGIRNELVLIPAITFAIILIVGLASVVWRPRHEPHNPA